MIKVEISGTQGSGKSKVATALIRTLNRMGAHVQYLQEGEARKVTPGDLADATSVDALKGVAVHVEVRQ